MSAFCNTNNNDSASAAATMHQCAYCHMYCHTMDECAMITGEYDEEYVDYYAEYAGAYDNLPMEMDEEEGNSLTEEEVAQWMREMEEEYDEDDYEENHSPEADVRWAKQSSMAAFDHFQRTGAQLQNRDFVGKKAGAYLKSEVCDDYGN